MAPDNMTAKTLVLCWGRRLVNTDTQAAVGGKNVRALAVLTQFWFTEWVWVSSESLPPSLPRSHSAVVCGGWHLALRLSCLPPPLFSALQWDHVVLLISQQWPYSLPFPLFSLPLCISSFPLSSSPSLTDTSGRLFVTSPHRRVDGLHFMRCYDFFFFPPEPRSFFTSSPHSPSSLEPWLSLASSPSFTRASKYPFAATVTPEKKRENV